MVIRDDEVALVAPYTAVSTITEGKYLIGNASHAISNIVNTSGSPTGLTPQRADFAKGCSR